MTTLTAAANAIRSRFDTQWGSTTPIYWHTDHRKPNEEAAFVDFEIGNVTAEQASIGAPGNNLERHFGVIHAAVFVPIESYPTLAETYAEQIAGIFKGQSFSGVTCWREINFLKGNPQGQWRGISVLIPFYYDDVI